MTENWSTEALEERRRYYREYRRKHRDRLKQYDREYWHKAAARRKGKAQSFTAGISS